MNKISVCMAVHNGEAYLQEQIDSILPQLKDEDELVISNDNSTDKTLTILLSYADPRIRILPTQYFNDPGKNFAFALKHCRNELIFLSDQDDRWHPDKIQRMKQAFKDADLVLCDSRIVKHNLDVLHSSFFSVTNASPGLFRNLIKSSYMGCCMAFHRKLLDKALPFPENGIMYDHWIGLIAERYFKVSFLEEVLVDHRRHFRNYSTTGERSQNSLPKKLKMRFHLLKNLLSS